MVRETETCRMSSRRCLPPFVSVPPCPGALQSTLLCGAGALDAVAEVFD